MSDEYKGEATIGSGWCLDGPTADHHKRCRWLFHSKSRGGYVSCKCDCHDNSSEAIAARIEELRSEQVEEQIVAAPERKPKTFPTDWDEQDHGGTIVQVGIAAVRKHAPALPDGSKDEGVRFRYRCATCDGTGKWHRTLQDALVRAGVHSDKHREESQ